MARSNVIYSNLAMQGLVHLLIRGASKQPVVLMPNTTQRVDVSRTQNRPSKITLQG
jgi:hypothetical protein